MGGAGDERGNLVVTPTPSPQPARTTPAVQPRDSHWAHPPQEVGAGGGGGPPPPTGRHPAPTTLGRLLAWRSASNRSHELPSRGH